MRADATSGGSPLADNALAKLGCPDIDVNVKRARQGAVLNGGAHRFRDSIASALDWWADAGVDAAIVETPRDWLAKTAPPPPRPTAAATAPAAPSHDLDAFVAFLMHRDYVPSAPPPRRRLPPEGKAGARVMFVTDMPDDADLPARRLLSAEAALFDAMLAAIGRSRDDIYLAALSPARIVGGRLGDAAAPLAALMRTHVSLVRPDALIALGDGAARTLLGLPCAEATRTLRPVNHDGGTVATTAIAHPRHLRTQPGLKAGAWAAMRRVIGELAR